MAHATDDVFPTVQWILSGVSWSVNAKQCSVAVLRPTGIDTSGGNFVMTVFAKNNDKLSSDEPSHDEILCKNFKAKMDKTSV